jgi:hypothetical protein
MNVLCTRLKRRASLFLDFLNIVMSPAMFYRVPLANVLRTAGSRGKQGRRAGVF